MAKNTNYQKLWRGAKRRETALHNLNQAILEAVPKYFKKKEEVVSFMAHVTYLRSESIK